MTTAEESPFEFLRSRLQLYIFQGFLLLSTNSLILFSILYHRLLRTDKTYTLVAALAAIDSADGIAAIIGGGGRLWLMSNHDAHVLVSRWQCLLAPWNAIWVVIGHIVDPTLVAISLDRFIFFAKPIKHFTFGLRYSLSLLAAFWGLGLMLLSYSVYLTYGYSEPEMPAICFTNFAFADSYYDFHYYYRVVLALFSVFLYICVPFLYRMRKASAQRQGSTAYKQYLRAQRKISTTFGISSGPSFSFYIAPMFFNALLPHLMPLSLASAMISSTYIIQNMNKLSNLFLYSLRHRDLKLGIRYMFKREQLTENAIKMNQSRIRAAAVGPRNQIKSSSHRNTIGTGRPRQAPNQAAKF